MKYIVEVNQKYLINVEAQSPLGAEHEILDNLSGIQGAMAYDAGMMKTDCFKTAINTCETISIRELRELSNDYEEACGRMGDAIEARKEQEEKIRQTEELLAKLKRDLVENIKNEAKARNEVANVKAALGLRDR